MDSSGETDSLPDSEMEKASYRGAMPKKINRISVYLTKIAIQLFKSKMYNMFFDGDSLPGY